MKVFVVALLAAFFSACVAQDDYKCETPASWYGHSMTVNPGEGRPRYGRIYYDETNMRVAFREEVNNTILRDIFLHVEKKFIRINETANTCQVYDLTRPFRPFGPGISDRFDGEFYIGSSDQEKDGVRVDIYSGETDRGGRFNGAWIPVNQETCLPVSEMFYDPESKELTIRRFYDIRAGIFDFSVFQPPPYCG